MKNRIVVSFLFLIVSLSLAENFSIQHYNYEDGLPSELVKQVLQDQTGFIWIATDGGLVRFDGQNFKVFVSKVPSRYIKNIINLNSSELLVCTDLGIVRVLHQPNFVNIEPFFKGAIHLTDSTLYYPKSIYMDRKKRLWVAEPSSIVRLDSKKKIRRYDFPHYVESKSYLKSFYFIETPKNELWVLSQTGYAFFYNARSDSFIQVPFFKIRKNWLINDVLALGDGHFLIGTSKGVYQITEINKNNIKVKQLYALKNVQALAIDSNNYLWIGTTGKGLFYVKNWQQNSPVKHFDQLDIHVINDLAVTKGGQIWVSSDNGLALIFKPLFEKIIDFSNYAIQNLASDGKSKIVATSGEQVFVREVKGNKDFFKKVWTNSGAIISTLAIDDQKIMLGHFDGRLTFLQNRTIKQIPLISNNTVFSIAVDQNKDVWLTQGNFKGITRVNGLHRKKLYHAKAGLKSLPIFVKTLNSKLWVGAFGDSSYLYIFLEKSNYFKNLSIPLKKPLNSNLEIYDVAFSFVDSTIYLAANVGLLKIHNKKAELIVLERNRAVRSVIVDNKNRVWLGTEHGAYCLKDTSLVFLDELAGFHNQTFAFRSITEDEQHRIYFGTYDGIYRQQTTFEIKPTSQPVLVGQYLNERTAITNFQLQKGVENKSTIRFDVSALMYPAHKIVYQWRLLGFQQNWVLAKTRNSILLSNLPEGHYQLQIRARQIGYAWSKPLTLPLKIITPWYQSKWMLVLIISVIVIFILVLTQLFLERQTRKQIAHELERSEFQISAIVNHTPIVLFMIDEKGVVTFAQGKGLKDLEKEFRPLLGLHLCQTDSEPIGIQEDCKKVLQGDSFVSVRKLGNKFYRFWFSPMKDGNGKITAALGIAIDITELKETEARLRKAISQSETSNKAKSEFIANMSHELRTPLNAIIGLGELMDDTNLTETQKEFLQTIRFSARELLKIINQILDFSKIESGKMELEWIPFDLKQLVQNIVNAISIMAKQKGLKFILEWDDQIPSHILGDPTRLGQVLVNLLGNAVKFTEKGSVLLKLKKQREDEDRVTILFVIKDTGIGIPKEKIDKIFGSFEQVDTSLTRKFGGTGLGLTITSRLIEMMDSHIHVDSVLNKGTTFKFELTFPKAKDREVEELPDFSIFLPQEQPKVKDEILEEPKTIESDEITILLVEDNVINQRVAKRMVENMGYKVEIANNGQEALEMLNKKKYDLVLMDIQMPVLDGLRATQKIRVKEINTDEHIPIIAMTAHAQKEDRDRCLEAGMDDYLSKPINMKILEEKIKQYLKK